MKIIFTLFLFFTTSIMFTQTDSLIWKKIIDKSIILDKDKQEIDVTSNFKLDSFQVKAWKYRNKIKSEVYLEKSKTKLCITSYLEKGKVFLVRVIEESQKSKGIDEAFKETEIYYENGIILNHRVLYHVPVCEWEFEYNINLNFKALDLLSSKIRNKVLG